MDSMTPSTPSLKERVENILWQMPDSTGRVVAAIEDVAGEIEEIRERQYNIEIKRALDYVLRLLVGKAESHPAGDKTEIGGVTPGPIRTESGPRNSPKTEGGEKEIEHV